MVVFFASYFIQSKIIILEKKCIRIRKSGNILRIDNNNKKRGINDYEKDNLYNISGGDVVFNDSL